MQGAGRRAQGRCGSTPITCLLCSRTIKCASAALLPPPAALTAPVGLLFAVGPLFVPRLPADADAAVSSTGGASESELALASHTAREQSLAVHASCEPSRE